VAPPPPERPPPNEDRLELDELEKADRLELEPAVGGAIRAVFLSQVLL
jgi:hypothetical protein